MALHTLACPRSLFTFSHEFTHPCTLSYGLVLPLAHPCTSQVLTCSHTFSGSSPTPSSTHILTCLTCSCTYSHTFACPCTPLDDCTHPHMPMYALACHRLHSQISHTLTSSHLMHAHAYPRMLLPKFLIFLHIRTLARLYMPAMSHALACLRATLSHGLACT